MYLNWRCGCSRPGGYGELAATPVDANCIFHHGQSKNSHRKVRNHGEDPYKGIFLVETISHSPSRGLLCDSEIFAKLRLTFVWSLKLYLVVQDLLVSQVQLILTTAALQARHQHGPSVHVSTLSICTIRSMLSGFPFLPFTLLTHLVGFRVWPMFK